MNWTTNTHRVLLFSQPLCGEFFFIFIFNLKKIKEFLMWWSFIFFRKWKHKFNLIRKKNILLLFLYVWKGIRKMIKIILLFILTIFYVISFKLQDISALTACRWVYILSSSVREGWWGWLHSYSIQDEMRWDDNIDDGMWMKTVSFWLFALLDVIKKINSKYKSANRLLNYIPFSYYFFNSRPRSTVRSWYLPFFYCLRIKSRNYFE